MGKRAVSRRDFLRIAVVRGAGLFFVGQIGGVPFRVPVAAAARSRAARSTRHGDQVRRRRC